MSAIKGIESFVPEVKEYDELILPKTNSQRTFSVEPRVLELTSYNHILWLEFKLKDVVLPNRKKNVRNHYTLYFNNYTKEIIFSRCESTVVYNYDDIVIDSYCFSLESGVNYFDSKWQISYDKIKFTYNSNFKMEDMTLISSGEWWWFDKGIIFNGTFTNNLPHFGYFELLNIIKHPKIKDKMIAATPAYERYINKMNENERKRQKEMLEKNELIEDLLPIKRLRTVLTTTNAKDTNLGKETLINSTEIIKEPTTPISSQPIIEQPSTSTEPESSKIKFGSGPSIENLKSMMLSNSTSLLDKFSKKLGFNSGVLDSIVPIQSLYANTPLLPSANLLNIYYRELCKGKIDIFVDEYYVPSVNTTCICELNFSELL